MIIVMMTCLFCDNELNAKTRPEHILLDALGGRKTSRRLICTECNGRFGSTIDRTLAESVKEIRNMLAHPSGSGKPAPGIRYDSPSGTVKLDAQGRPSLVRKPFKLERDGADLTLELHADNPAQMAQTLKNVAAHLKTTPSDLIAALKRGTGSGMATTYSAAPARQGRLSLGDEDALRSIVKSCLELFAWSAGNDAVRTEAFAAARRFVQGGEPQFNIEQMALDTRPLPQEAILRERFGAALHLVYVASDTAGQTLGYFRLYGFTAWTVLLAEHGAPPDIRCGLISDPTSGEWSDEIASEIEVPIEWLEAAEVDLNEAGRLLGKVHELARQRSLEREADRIVREEFDRRGIHGDTVVDDKATKERLLFEIQARMASLWFKVPHVRPVTWEEVEMFIDDSDAK